MSTEYRCPACGLFFKIDLDPDEVQLCCLCGYHKPEPVQIVEAKQLCSECAGRRPMTDQELRDQIAEAFDKVGL